MKYTRFELSAFQATIIADLPADGSSSPVRMVFGYGSKEPWTASHRREYTSADARALCAWLNQRVEYLSNLLFHPPAPPLGPELGSGAAPAVVLPLDGVRSVSLAPESGSDVTGADDLEITLSEQELAEAALLTCQETY